MFLPSWLSYLKDKKQISGELVAGLSMGLLAIPQSLGYAVLAGLPPIYGLYASIVPTIVYAYVGPSSVQAVGPVAITAIMTNAALMGVAPVDYPVYASVLAFMVGVILLIGRVFKAGFIVEFISISVSSGFVSAAAVLIVLSQLKGLLGLPLSVGNFIDLAKGLSHLSDALVHPPTALIGITALIILCINRYRPQWLWGFLKDNALASKLFVVAVVMVSIGLSRVFEWHKLTKTLTDLPANLSISDFYTLQSSNFWQLMGDGAMIGDLLPSALLIAFVGFVSTSAVSRHEAQKRREPYSPNKELLGLGAANIASTFFGGFAVSGGISRTSLNISLGATSPLSSIITACVIGVILLSFGTLLTGLPYAILSAIIVSSSFGMIDFEVLKQGLAHDKADMLVFLSSFLGVCLFGLNIGLMAGLFVSFASVIYRSHRVHVAVIGQVDDSEHFRNIKRHTVRTFETLTLIRIDESLYFANAKYVQEAILQEANTVHIVLVMTAVNHIDLTAQAMLSELNKTLVAQGKTLHFAEIKSFVMDSLTDTPLLNTLSGQVFLSTTKAVQNLS